MVIGYVRLTSTCLPILSPPLTILSLHSLQLARPVLAYSTVYILWKAQGRKNRNKHLEKLKFIYQSSSLPRRFWLSWLSSCWPCSSLSGSSKTPSSLATCFTLLLTHAINSKSAFTLSTSTSLDFANKSSAAARVFLVRIEEILI